MVFLLFLLYTHHTHLKSFVFIVLEWFTLNYTFFFCKYVSDFVCTSRMNLFSERSFSIQNELEPLPSKTISKNHPEKALVNVQMCILFYISDKSSNYLSTVSNNPRGTSDDRV